MATAINRGQQSDIAATTAVLAGLVLKREIITQILREDIMKESVIFQEIDAAADARGFQRGIQSGIQQGEQSLVIRQLQRRVGELTVEMRWPKAGRRPSQVEALPLEQLEALGEALLDFSSETDLQQWLQHNT